MPACASGILKRGTSITNDRTGILSRVYIAALLAWLLLIAEVLPSSAQTTERTTDWTDASHGNRVPANYDVVLPDDRINELYNAFMPDSWAAEEADMTEIYGERGSSDSRGPGGAGGRAYGRMPLPNLEDVAKQLGLTIQRVQADFALFPDFDAVAQALEMDVDDLSEALGIPEGSRRPGGGQGLGGPGQRNPIWVPVTVGFNGQTWQQVGFRYKRNTSLSMSWASNANPPFKSNFDQIEDDYPELSNQSLYGFKQLGFGNNRGYSSLQREKVAADVFRAAGVPASETAFYAVFVDNGNGDGFQPWGFYTAVELPDDTLTETQFADDDGNMYKPSGGGATFAEESFNEESFPKRSNRDSDFADVLALFDALHAETRQSNPNAWRQQLEEVFDVERFLRWLATNQFVQKRDAYGSMAKDFYLCADSVSGQLVWTPFDNNEAMDDGSQGPGPGGPGRGGQAAWSFSLDEIPAEEWPLIGFLAEDEYYNARYVELVQAVSNNVFAPETMNAVYEDNFQLLADFFHDFGELEDIEALRAATDELVEHFYERARDAERFLRESGAA